MLLRRKRNGKLQKLFCGKAQKLCDIDTPKKRGNMHHGADLCSFMQLLAHSSGLSQERNRESRGVQLSPLKAISTSLSEYV